MCIIGFYIWIWFLLFMRLLRLFAYECSLFVLHPTVSLHDGVCRKLRQKIVDRSLPCAFQVTTCGVFTYILFSNSCCFRCLFGTFCCWIQVNTCEYVVYFTCVCGFCCSSIQVSTLFSYRVTTFRYVFYFSYILLCDSFYFKCLLSFLVLQFMWLHVFMFSTLHTSHVFVA